MPLFAPSWVLLVQKPECWIASLPGAALFTVIPGARHWPAG
ncbi:hypothetical protein [Modestobacter marinus]|nr:hypothetical protein [Modestobacter marinus]